MAMASLWRIFNPSHGDSKPQKLPIHHHALHPSVFPLDCFACSENKKDAKGYYCPQCKFYFHKECAESPLEINHPSHPSHPLKLRKCGPPGYSDEYCRLCGKKLGILVYHCSICNFSLDTACARKLHYKLPSIDYPKAHEHRLHLVAKHISFTCDACGTNGDRAPYLCRKCNFMIHRDCIPLPRVIHITRHEHRISRSYFIGPGKFDCGVCRLRLDGRYGGYRCSVCPDYVVHLRCATRDYVWDGMELEGKPEVKDDIKDIQPFKVVHDKVIKHFSHEHHLLKLNDEGIVCHDTIHCSACALPIYFDAYYKCLSCAFVLHKTCANLRRKLRHGLHKHPLTLRANIAPHGYNLFHCTACQRLCSGFKYVCCNVELDVRCCSVQEPFTHESHPHPLFFTSLESKICGACNELASSVLSCVDCNFALGFDCATLPNRVKHKYDTHFLSICYGEKASGQYWCDVCEKKTNPNTRFYKCEDCSSTLHIDCIIGNFTFWRPGYTSISRYQVTIIPNVFASRPHCHICFRRCKDTSGIIYIEEAYLCSSKCLRAYCKSSLTLVKSWSWLAPDMTNLWDLFRIRLY